MALLDELGTRLSDQGLASSSGADGWVLYKSQLPDSTTVQDRAVSLFQTPGEAPEARVEIDRPHVQVVVRGASQHDSSTGYEEAEAKAQAIKRDLHEFSGALSGRHYPGIWALQDPAFAGYDQSRRPRFSVNFRAWRSRT